MLFLYIIFIFVLQNVYEGGWDEKSIVRTLADDILSFQVERKSWPHKTSDNALIKVDKQK